MIASAPLRARPTRFWLVITALLTANAGFGQTVSTYLPPEVLQHGRAPRSGLFQLGMFDISPHAAASILYDDNIFLNSTNREGDLIYVISPGIDITKGLTDHDAITTMRLTYNPAFVFFTKGETNNSIDQFVRWNGNVSLSRLSIALSQNYESSEGGIADVGNRVGQDYYLTTLRARYEVSAKTSAEVSGSFRILDYDQLINSTEWNEDNAMHYEISPKVRLGLGVSVGQLIVDDTPDALTNGIGVATDQSGNTQTYVTPSVRAAYRTSEKTEVSMSVGVETRTYDDGGTAVNPVFSVSGSYSPWEFTSLTLEAHQREQNSAVLAGQDYIATGLTFGVNHRLKERYRLHLSLTYDHSDYKAVTSGASASRVDDYYLLRYGADAILATSWTIGVFHQYRVNSSSSGFDFDDHQVGLQTVWSY